ncbi:B12-binding domain-containing radical SAM protein [Corallococcus carmarthensis]|uniref:Radical SAM protein n=1 Tax=Corallococcus carmarthensis TaxID=2316728 RepID=A0A3A8K552_9BACT|nr:cobalamin-dependent protein [Corallococcus carmarthensis]NOK18522.1 radical SAM protein [Corallococcus carmarthensis]RKG99464.1 radical SAM protein [Corallococcus carmarthensis]
MSTPAILDGDRQAPATPRPVWLFSLDSSRYPDAFPLASGNLKAYFVKHGRTAASTDVEIVHFHSHLDVPLWLLTTWAESARERARAALATGVRPTVGISCYTWNTEEFLNLVRQMKEMVPGLLVVAGGPQVQRAEDYLRLDLADVVVLGEGELTFTELLDATFAAGADASDVLPPVAGIAWVDVMGQPHRTQPRERVRNLDELESPLDVVPLRDASGVPLYKRAAYETARGCPYRCAFCEWGTGAIGTKLFEYSIPRIRADLERMAEAGIEEFFFCDSNFGALRSDAEKAELLVELRARYGRPTMFCTSWSKSHNERVQHVVRSLHAAGLIEHYTLALETLTPSALATSNRTNLPMNRFQRIVDEMAQEDIPITTELIWALPGDNLADFERNLDTITAIFPSSSLYGYTLLPGTEFFDRREEYRIQTETLREMGNWKLDYVVASHTFSREEGIRGYFLITAHNILNRGNLIPLTSRFLALDERVSVSRVLKGILQAILASWGGGTRPEEEMGLHAYANRDRIYLRLLQEREACFGIIRRAMREVLLALAPADEDLRERAEQILSIDEALSPGMQGETSQGHFSFEFNASAVHGSLRRMRLPPPGVFSKTVRSTLAVGYPVNAADLLAPGSMAPGVVRGHHAVVP